jgi:glucose-6-phosphate 1-dehydrogenase
MTFAIDLCGRNDVCGIGKIILNLLDEVRGNSEDQNDVLPIPTRIVFAYNFFVRHHNGFDLMIDEIIEGVDMLFNKSLEFQEGWQKLDFVLQTEEKN